VDSANLVLGRTESDLASACFHSNVNYKNRYDGLFTGMQMNINLLLYQRPPKRFALAAQNSEKFKTHNYK
jgi:hypothetical protein